MSLAKRFFLGYVALFLITAVPCFVPRNYAFESQTVYAPTRAPHPIRTPRPPRATPTAAPTPTPVYVRARLPRDVVDEVDALQRDADARIGAISSERARVSAELSRLSAQISAAAEGNRRVAEAIAADDRSDISDISEDAGALSARAVRDAHEALLVSAESRTERRGASMLQRMLRRDPNDRSRDVLPRPNGALCVAGAAANFTLWLPFEAVAERIVLSYNSTAPPRTFEVVAYLDRDAVFASGAVCSGGQVTEVQLARPTRVRTIKVAAFGEPDAESVCIGDVTVVSPANIE